MITFQNAMTEEQIERIVERTIDRLDRHLLSNQITQDQYDRDIALADAWAREQYALARQA